MDVQAVPHGRPTIAINAILLGVAWTSVFLRFYTRLRIMKTVFWEDLLAVASILFFTVLCATVIATAKVTELGAGRTLPLSNALDAIKYSFLSETFYILSLLALKISLGLFFLRFTTERWKKIVIWSIMGVLIVFSITAFFYNLFHCGTFSSFTELAYQKIYGTCSSTPILAITYTHAALMTFTDWFFAFMPIFILKSVNMRPREKLIAGFLMMFASLSGVASLVRFKFVPSIAVPSKDVWIESTWLVIWSGIEVGIGIVAASLACLRPLFRKYLNVFSQRTDNFSSHGDPESFQMRLPSIRIGNRSSDEKELYGQLPSISEGKSNHGGS